mmetsp:Transcript_68279/g.173403  ORF Transcript_68279/g.173403 Transcript_68279/m.173403 type:complete len:247 (+) Transcript_68279:306-1046(+)
MNLSTITPLYVVLPSRGCMYATCTRRPSSICSKAAATSWGAAVGSSPSTAMGPGTSDPASALQPLPLALLPEALPTWPVPPIMRICIAIMGFMPMPPIPPMPIPMPPMPMFIAAIAMPMFMPILMGFAMPIIMGLPMPMGFMPIGMPPIPDMPMVGIIPMPGLIACMPGFIAAICIISIAEPAAESEAAPMAPASCDAERKAVISSCDLGSVMSISSRNASTKRLSPSIATISPLEPKSKHFFSTR